MPRQPRKVDPRRTYVVADTATKTRLTPAKAALVKQEEQMDEVRP